MKKILAPILLIAFMAIAFAQAVKTGYFDVLVPNNPASTFIDIGTDLSINGSTVKIADIVDDDTLAADSATSLVTEQAIKAYVDTSIGGITAADVVGPAGATDNAIPLYDGTTGKLIKNSTLTYIADVLSVAGITATGNIGAVDITASGDLAGNTVTSTTTVSGNTLTSTTSVTGATIVGTTSTSGGNLLLSGNDIASTDTDGDINLAPDGTGEVTKTTTNGIFKLGVNPDRLNLLIHPSFETSIAEGSCSGCTASSEDVETLATGENATSLKMAYSAATGCYTVTKTTSAQYAPVNMAGSCFIKTSAQGVTFEVLANGVVQNTIPVSSSDSWQEYTRSFVGGVTSVGYRVCANTSITDSVFVDECFLGAKDVLNKVGYDTGWEEYTPTFTGIGTPTITTARFKRLGDTLLLNMKITTGTVDATAFTISLPSGLTVKGLDTSTVLRFGHIEVNTNNETTVNVIGVGGDSFLQAGLRNDVTSNPFTENITGITLFSSTQAFSVNATVPISEWQATFDSISDVGGGSNVRLDTANGYGSTATKIRRFSNERVNIGSSLNCVDSATAGFSCTVLRSGFYFVSYSDGFNGTAYQGLSLNASSLTNGIQALAANEMLAMNYQVTANTFTLSSWSGWLWAGDIVRPHTNGDAIGSFNRTSFSMVGLLDQINAILKDVVMSPNSSNGKPVFVSVDVSGGAAITNNEDSFLASCVDANPFVCTFTTDYWHDIPKCWSEHSGSTSIITRAYSESLTGVTVVTNNDAGGLDKRSFQLWCKGSKK